MKRRIALSIALALSVLVSLVSLPVAAQGQQPQQRFRADSGVLTPAVGQTFRLTINGVEGAGLIRARIRWMQYGAQGCSGAPPVCRHIIVNQGVTPVETLGPDDALSMDIPGNGAGMRVIVESNSRNARVLGIVFDTSTQRVVAFFQSIEFQGTA